MNRYYGNIGDVWKHLVLAELLALEPPKRYWETHAGSASYPLTHSPDRDYGVYRFLERGGSAPELAGSRYAAELGRLSAAGEAPSSYPGSALLAMQMLGREAEYLLCDLDPESVASLRAAAAELGLSEQEVVREADGMTTVVEEARRLKDEAEDVVVTIDPFQPFEIAGGISALELAAGLIEDDFRVIYWYGYDTPEQRSYPMGVLREYARGRYERLVRRPDAGRRRRPVRAAGRAAAGGRGRARCRLRRRLRQLLSGEPGALRAPRRGRRNGLGGRQAAQRKPGRARVSGD